MAAASYSRRKATRRYLDNLRLCSDGFGPDHACDYFGLRYCGTALADCRSTSSPEHRSAGSRGRLLNSIVGSLIMTGIGLALGAPVGILAGTYLAEYGANSKLVSVVRFINDILLSAPSIIVGLFVYELLVVPVGHFSALAGAVALAVLGAPIMVRTTEDMLNLVPNSLREAASALGMPRSLVIRHVAYRAVMSGLITGVLLAIARMTGETAPLYSRRSAIRCFRLIRGGRCRLFRSSSTNSLAAPTPSSKSSRGRRPYPDLRGAGAQHHGPRSFGFGQAEVACERL